MCIKCRVLPVFHIYLKRHDIVFMPSHEPGHMKNLFISYIVRAMALFESYPQRVDSSLLSAFYLYVLKFSRSLLTTVEDFRMSCLHRVLHVTFKNYSHG